MKPLKNGQESPFLSQNNSNERLLIVDDEPHIRRPLVRALSLLGYSVKEAGSGDQALALLQEAAYDLMVLDMKMPGLHGIDVMPRARELQPDLAIVILTGHASLESALAAIKSASADYVRKPVSTAELVGVVKRALQKRARKLQQQQLQRVLAEALAALYQAQSSSYLPPDSGIAASRAKAARRSLDVIQVPPLKLDYQKRLVTVEGDHQVHLVQLTKGEAAILASLMAQPDHIFSCQELVEAAWGYRTEETEAKSVIRPFISRLRGKLNVTAQTAALIHTVRRRGYYFAPENGATPK